MFCGGLFLSQTLVSNRYDHFWLCLIDCKHSIPVFVGYFYILHSSDDILHALLIKEKWTSMEETGRNLTNKFFTSTKILYVPIDSHKVSTVSVLLLRRSKSASCRVCYGACLESIYLAELLCLVELADFVLLLYSWAVWNQTDELIGAC